MPRPSHTDLAELDALVRVLPESLRDVLRAVPNWTELIEVVMDLGRRAEARLADRSEALLDREVTQRDLDHVVAEIGEFTADNRAGIPGTLHRFSVIRNRLRRVVGLTVRRGRALYGTTHIVADIVASDRSIMLLGPPGVGKTTLLREAARVLANDHDRRVVVVDTSNEIAGDGDVPHPGIGRSRRMQVAEPDLQHRVMIEAVENHMPEVIVVDEIGTELEAQAARTIAERGVQLIATAHGQTLENVLLNPLLSDLVGGIESVTLSDDEARRRSTQKTVLERRAPPTFDTLIELHSRDEFVIHHEVAETVDAMLRAQPTWEETRVRMPDGRIARETRGRGDRDPSRPVTTQPGPQAEPTPHGLRIMPFGVSRNRFVHAIEATGYDSVGLVRDLAEADMVVTSRSFYRKRPRLLRDAEARGTPVYVLRNNTELQMQACLHDLHDGRSEGNDRRANGGAAPPAHAEPRRRVRLTSGVRPPR